MKSKHFTFLILLFISSCTVKVDHQKAQAMAESLLNDLKNENYANLNQYYTASFNESEPVEQKIAQYKQLKETTGPIESYELMSSKENYDSDRGLNELQLIYKVKCSRVTVQETFL